MADFSAFWRASCATSILDNECLRRVYNSLVKHRAVTVDQVAIRPSINPNDFGYFDDTTIYAVEGASEHDIRETFRKTLNADQARR